LVDDCLGNLRRPIRFMVLPGGHLTRACKHPERYLETVVFLDDAARQLRKVHLSE